MVLLDVRTPFLIENKPARSTKNSLLIIEAAYDLETDDSTWFSNLVRAFRPYLDSGHGLYGYAYDWDSQKSLLRVDAVVFLGCEGISAALARVGAMSPPEFAQALFTSPPCRSLSQVYAALGLDYTEHEAVRFLHRETGVIDGFHVNASQTNGRGYCFVGPLDRVRPFPARTAGLLSRVARHIAAAQRLRQSVRRTDDRTSLDVEAVLDQRGGMLHAEGEAKGKPEREILTTAVRSLVEAKGRFRESDPEQVTAIWNALVDGRWSLVDSLDRDGKRFLLARRNALELHEPSALTPSERQVAALFARRHSSNLVAYELGLSAPVVSTTLQRALRKLHLRSRAELVALFNR